MKFSEANLTQRANVGGTSHASSVLMSHDAYTLNKTNTAISRMGGVLYDLLESILGPVSHLMEEYRLKLTSFIGDRHPLVSSAIFSRCSSNVA